MIKIVIGLMVVIFIAFFLIIKTLKENSIYANEKEQQNPMEGKKVAFIVDEKDEKNADGVKGHLEVIGKQEEYKNYYEKYIKRLIDILLSFCGMVILSPLYVLIIILIKIEDPGPVIFTQKRVGKNKQYFKLHKFRSMKTCTPHDIPTHQLENPEQYITKIGKFIRTHSLDELPQIWDIFIGNMSIIGPRPALWNQDVLIAEREKYHANDIRPGLTGWAQINGRDELEIQEKARLDGEYVKRLSFVFDMKCFFGTIISVLKHDGVVEGGTGQLNKR